MGTVHKGNGRPVTRDAPNGHTGRTLVFLRQISREAGTLIKAAERIQWAIHLVESDPDALRDVSRGFAALAEAGRMRAGAEVARQRAVALGIASVKVARIGSGRFRAFLKCRSGETRTVNLSPREAQLLEILGGDRGISEDKFVGWKRVGDVCAELGLSSGGSAIGRGALKTVIWRLRQQLTTQGGLDRDLVEVDTRFGMRVRVLRGGWKDGDAGADFDAAGADA